MRPLAGLMTFAILALTASALAAEPAPLKIHMISGSREYKSEESLKNLQKHLEDSYKVRITASWATDSGAELPNAERIKEADVLLVFARRMKLPEAQLALLRAHWESGKPVVAIRTASHAWSNQENATFDRKVLGGNFTGHLKDEPVAVVATDAARDHPVLKGVGPWNSRKLYKVGPQPTTITVLQTGAATTADGVTVTQPVTWTNTYKGARIFYTSLGVPEDFDEPSYILLLTNAVFWTAQRDPEQMKK